MINEPSHTCHKHMTCNPPLNTQGGGTHPNFPYPGMGWAMGEVNNLSAISSRLLQFAPVGGRSQFYVMVKSRRPLTDPSRTYDVTGVNVNHILNVDLCSKRHGKIKTLDTSY